MMQCDECGQRRPDVRFVDNAARCCLACLACAPEPAVRAGATYLHSAFGLVDVLRVYATTCTVRYTGRGLSDGRRLTQRGVRISDLMPRDWYRVRDDR